MSLLFERLAFGLRVHVSPCCCVNAVNLRRVEGRIRDKRLDIRTDSRVLCILERHDGREDCEGS